MLNNPESTSETKPSSPSETSRPSLPREASWTIVLENIGLVHKAVNDVCGHHQDRGDLVQEGLLGLFEGARRFDPGVGVAFSTYVYPWIRKYVLAFYQTSPHDTDQLPEDDVTPSPGDLEADIDRLSLNRAIAESLDVLNEDERLIILIRWLSDVRPTQRLLAFQIGLSAARVAQIELAAFAKLRRHMEERRIWTQTKS